ncbi:MAG: oxidoreductase [Bacteroidota bacterium]
MKDNINVGLIGYGMAGQVFHAPMINSIPCLELKKIRETKHDNIDLALNRYPSTTIVGESEAIFSDPDIDLVVIAASNTFHYPLAKQALLSGKHVVVDKPFTNTVNEADELIEIAKRENKLLSVYHNRRYDSGVRTVRKILDENILGRLVEVEIHFDRFRPNLKENAWREKDLPGSGILYDLGSHLIDQALIFFGRPESINADIQIQRAGAEVDDYFQVELFYDRLKIILKSGMLVKEAGPQTVIHGEKGSFIKYGLDVQEEALKAGQIPNEIADWGVEPENLQGKLHLDSNGESVISRIKSEPGDYRDYYKNIYQTLSGEAVLDVTAEQARDVIKMIELARQSSSEGRTILLDK